MQLEETHYGKKKSTECTIVWFGWPRTRRRFLNHFITRVSAFILYYLTVLFWRFPLALCVFFSHQTGFGLRATLMIVEWTVRGWTFSWATESVNNTLLFTLFWTLVSSCPYTESDLSPTCFTYRLKIRLTRFGKNQRANLSVIYSSRLMQ